MGFGCCEAVPGGITRVVCWKKARLNDPVHPLHIREPSRVQSPLHNMDSQKASLTPLQLNLRATSASVSVRECHSRQVSKIKIALAPPPL